MKAKLLTAITALIYLSAAVAAQTTAVQKTDNYILTTNPPGATAYFNGDYNLVINTPAILPPNLSGKYEVRISRPGYESWKGELSFLPETSNNININLTQKTRFRAGLRSLFIPGWGQHYEGSSLRGTAFTLGVIGTATILYFADRKYLDKRNAFDIANQNYSNASSIDERIRLKAVKDATQQTAYKAETDRRRVFYVGVGLWIYSIFDSMIFFPEESAYYPTVTADGGGGAKVSLVVKF